MAITANKLLGKKGGALVVVPKSPLVVSSVGKLDKIPEKPKEDVVYTIRTKVLEIDKLLKGTLAAEKVQQKKERQQKENEKRQRKEEKLEKPDKDRDKETPKKLIPKIGFLEKIKQFITKVLLGWIAFNLIKFLPKIINFLKPIAAVAGFLIDFAGKLLNGLVTFVDWGYKGLDATKGWIGDKFGEGAAEKFESFMGNLTKMFNGIVLLGMGIAKLASMGKPKIKQPKRSIKNKIKRQKKLFKRRFDPKRADKLARVKNLKKIKADRLLRVKKFGRLRKFAKVKQFVGKGIDLGKNIVKRGGKVAQTVTKGVKTAVKTATPVIKSATKTVTKLAKTGLKTATTAAKTAAKTGTKLAKTGLKTGLKGLKALKKVVSPIVKKIPFIGALLDFALNYFVFKEPLGRSAFMAIGAGLAAWLGGIIGSVIPVGGTFVGAALGGWAGDKLSGALYDAIFKEKKLKEGDKNEEKKKTTKIRRNREGIVSMLASGNRGKIEQGLYQMRINAQKGSGKAYSDMVGNPKYAGDVDLIMKHGLQKVSIDGGRVSLQSNASINPKETNADAAIRGNKENIVPLDVNGVSKKADNISMNTSYQEGGDQTVVVPSRSQTLGDDTTQSTEKLVPAVIGGGGDDDEIGDLLYKGG